MKISIFIIPVFCCLWLVKNQALATDERSYGQGEIVAQESNVMAEWDLKSVPGFKEPSTISETSINENNIENRIGRSLQTSQSAGLVQDTYNQRSRFDLDTERDPLFTDADKIIKNPEKTLNVKAQTQILGVGKTRHNCIKGYDLLERKCRWVKVARQTGVRREERKYRVNISAVEAARKGGSYAHKLQNLAIQADPTRYSRVLKNKSFKRVMPTEAVPAFLSVFHGRDEKTRRPIAIETDNITSVKVLRHFGSLIEINTGRVASGFGTEANTRQYYEVEVTTFKEIPTYELQDSNNCQDLEGQVDTGACEYSSKRCVEGAETRLIEGTPVYSKCWAEEAVYQCRTVEEDHCTDFAKKGCLQIGSRCLTYLEQGHCVKWQQTYECTSGKRQASITTLTGKTPFCLDGHCVDQTWDGNADMVDALAKLAIFKEMQKGLDANMGVVFKGRNLGCSRVPTGFKDCCKIKGWGKDIHLASCSPEEEDLGEQRKLNKCLFIGTYCADKVLGVCTRKKTTFCCYPSKLSKIINVQGKRQLGLSFGNAEHPECGGLTLDQISRIDFSQLDLSELLSEMFANLKTPNTTNLGKDIQKSMTNKTYMINDKKKKITQGKAHGNF